MEMSGFVGFFSSFGQKTFGRPGRPSVRPTLCDSSTWFVKEPIHGEIRQKMLHEGYFAFDVRNYHILSEQECVSSVRYQAECLFGRASSPPEDPGYDYKLPNQPLCYLFGRTPTGFSVTVKVPFYPSVMLQLPESVDWTVPGLVGSVIATLKSMSSVHPMARAWFTLHAATPYHGFKQDVSVLKIYFADLISYRKVVRAGRELVPIMTWRDGKAWKVSEGDYLFIISNKRQTSPCG